MKTFKVPEVANMFSVHPNTIKLWKRNGLIPSATVGRDWMYTIDDIKTYANKINKHIDELLFMSKEELIEHIKELKGGCNE